MVNAIPPRQPNPYRARPLSSETRRADDDIVERFRAARERTEPIKDADELVQDRQRRRERSAQIEEATATNNAPTTSEMIDPSTGERLRRRTHRERTR